MDDENKTIENYYNGTVNNLGVSSEPVQKKKKGLKIALIAIASVVGVLGITFLVVYLTNKDYISNKWALMTKNDTEYFRYTVDRNIDSYEAKSMSFKGSEESSVAVPDSFKHQGTIEVSVSKEIGNLFGSKSDFAGLDDLSVDYELSVDQGKAMGAVITPGYKGVDILTIAGLYNTSDKKTYISLPSYKPDIIELTPVMSKFMEKSSSDTSKSLEDLIDMDKFQEKIGELGTKNVNVFADILKAIYDGVINAELKKDVEVSVNGLSKELNVMYFSVPQEKISEFINRLIGGLDGIMDAASSSMKTGTGSTQLDLSGISGTVKQAIDKFLTDNKVTIEVQLYVDEKGIIAGGNAKLAFGETSVKLDILKIQDENNENKASEAAELSVNGINIILFKNDHEKKDGKTTFEASIKPGAMVGALLKSAASLNLVISGSYTDLTEKGRDIDVSLVLKNAGEEYARIRFANTMTIGSVTMPIDPAKDNVINVYDLPSSDYISIGTLGKMLIEKIEKMNDEGVNNFVNGLLKKSLNMEMSQLKAFLEPPQDAVVDMLIKKALNNILSGEAA